MSEDIKKSVTIKYKNWRGEIADRTIIPQMIWLGKTKYHPDEQWLLNAYDCDKQAARDFAIKDIIRWELPIEHSEDCAQ